MWYGLSWGSCPPLYPVAVSRQRALCYTDVKVPSDQTPTEGFLDTVTVARAIVDALEDKKAENILLLDLAPTGMTGQKAEQGEYIITDYFVIATGNSDRQIRALAENVREAIKILYDKSPAAVDGEASSGWVLMDYGDIIVHIMSAEMRSYYDLEGLYRKANTLLRIQ